MFKRVKEVIPTPNVSYSFLGPAFPAAAVNNAAFGNGPPGMVYNPQGNLTYQNGNCIPASTNILSGINWGGSGASGAMSGTAGPYTTNLMTVTSTTTTALSSYWWQFSTTGLASTGSGPYYAWTWHVARGNQPWAAVGQWSSVGQFPTTWSFYNFDTDTVYANGAYSFTRTILANGIVRLTQIIQTYTGTVGWHGGVGPMAGPSAGTVSVGATVLVSDPVFEMTLDPANYTANFNYIPTPSAGPVFNCRFDYDPNTLAARGWLIEEGRTNYIRTSCCMAAVAGTPGTLPTNWSVVTTGGLTTNVANAGTPSPNVIFENGIPCVDIQVTGTATGTSYQLAFEVNNQISSANGQAWAHSAFLKLVGGSFANVTQLQLQTASYSSAPALLTTYTTNITNPTGSALKLQRFTGSITIADASVSTVRPGIGFTCSIGAAINFTLRIGLVQLERGAFATSPLALWGSTQPRNSDQANFAATISSFWNASQGTVVCKFMVEAVTSPGGNQQFPYYLNGGTSNDELYTSIKSGHVTHSMSILSSGTFDMVGPVPAAMTLYKTAVGYITGNSRGAVNGAYTGAAIPQTLRIGMTGGTFYAGSNFLNGWLQSWSYYNTRLPDNQLLVVTA